MFSIAVLPHSPGVVYNNYVCMYKYIFKYIIYMGSIISHILHSLEYVAYICSHTYNYIIIVYNRITISHILHILVDRPI